MNWKQRLTARYFAWRIGKAAGLNRKERKQIMEWIKKILGASWVTTVLGWLATAIGAQYVDWTDPTTHAIVWGKVLVAVIAVLASRFMKDSFRTGGTAPSTAEAGVRMGMTVEEAEEQLPGTVPDALIPGAKGSKGEPGDPGPRGKTGKSG